MGDRARIIFFDSYTVSPAVYLHWHGALVPEWLEALKHIMADRRRDAGFAAARFVGLCHTQIPGNLSLGISSISLTLSDLRHADRVSELSPGNAGIVIVDTADFTWRAYAGYLADHSTPTERNPA